LMRTFRRTFPRHFVPGYNRSCPYAKRQTPGSIHEQKVEPLQKIRLADRPRSI
jgi:hypothetical protein